MGLLALLVLLLSWQATDQIPPIGIIDFYGIRSLPEAQVRQALDFHEGDQLSSDQFGKRVQAAERKLEALPGIKKARLNFICCAEGNKLILFVGIEETGARCQEFAPAPQGTTRLPADVVQASKDIDAAFENMQADGLEEDDSQGYALFHDPGMRAVQLRFPALAEKHLTILRDVLRNSSDASERAFAAEVLGYANDKQAVVSDLLDAMRDASDSVRNNAMRALMVFARYAPKEAGGTIRIPGQQFVDMLNSCIWTDRNKSAAALAELTKGRDPAIMTELRMHALPSLVEMARWRSLGHATYSLWILGRLGGLSDEAIQMKLDRWDRESVIGAALKATQASKVA
jgi:HEAT repeats